MTDTEHLLIVEHDRASREQLCAYLAQQSIATTVIERPSGMRALRAAFKSRPPDLCVLDVSARGGLDFKLYRELRASAHHAIPVILLGERADEGDRILGLELGADDFQGKPYAPRELLARVRAVLRRTRMLPPNMQPAPPAAQLRFGHWRLDLARHQLHRDQGAAAAADGAALAGTEYRLLRAFLDHPQRVLSRGELLALVHEGSHADKPGHAAPFARSIDLLVGRLRQRLGDTSRAPRHIRTVRGEGYLFAAAVELIEHAG